EYLQGVPTRVPARPGLEDAEGLHLHPGDLSSAGKEVARRCSSLQTEYLQVIKVINLMPKVDKGQVLTHMRAGDFFGEIGILNLDGFNRRTADVRSVGYSELFSLSREDVLSAMKDYPRLRRFSRRWVGDACSKPA
ncbi:cyclic nucleotide-gated cation channel alpha-3, partial [Caerostris extrusa]